MLPLKLKFLVKIENDTFKTKSLEIGTVFRLQIAVTYHFYIIVPNLVHETNVTLFKFGFIICEFRSKIH